MQLQTNSKIEMHSAVWKSLVSINIIKKNLKIAKINYI